MVSIARETVGPALTTSSFAVRKQYSIILGAVSISLDLQYDIQMPSFAQGSAISLKGPDCQHQSSQSEDELNVIALHLRSGASACAIRGEKSIDTSMGLTPLSGLPGATKEGDVDPSLIFHHTSGPSSPQFSYGSAAIKEIHVTRVCSSLMTVILRLSRISM